MSYQTPPEFNKTKKKKGNHIIYLVTVAGISFVLAFGGTCLANLLTGSKTTTVTTDGETTQVSGNYSGEINDVSDVAAKCGPSVVEITTESVSSGNSMFGQYVSEGAGSGVIWTSDGYIVTNNHVIDGASTIKVTLTDGTSYDATLVGADSQTDLAVLKIDAEGLTPVTVGDSDALEVGDPAIAIGNPLGELGGTVTTGIISALDREITVNNETMTLLQTDAAINPGNSGGGLFDGEGNLIGIVNAKTSSTGIEGLGFAIPISGAVDTIEDLMKNGEVTDRPALNVSLYDYTANSGYGNSQSNYASGCYIVQVVEGGAADQAGLQKMDRIVSFDGQNISATSEVKAILRKHSIGDQVDMTVERDGKEINVTITLQAQSQTQAQSYSNSEDI